MMQTFQDLLYTLYFRGYSIIAYHLYFGSFAVSLKGALMVIERASSQQFNFQNVFG